MTKPDCSGSGEARLQSRRRRWLRYLVIAFGLSIVAGMLTGEVGMLVAQETLPAAWLVAIWLVVIAGLVWFTRDYFDRVDEVDRLDNLWAGMIAFFAYLLTLGSWALFHDVGIVPAPDQYAIAAISIAAMLAAYVARKLGWR